MYFFFTKSLYNMIRSSHFQHDDVSSQVAIDTEGIEGSTSLPVVPQVSVFFFFFFENIK